MMRKLFVAGNWKMNLDEADATALAGDLRANLSGDQVFAKVDVAVYPPFVYLPAVGKVLSNSKIQVGAQNVYFESRGAFTGEISVAMLKDVGCRYSIIGHSERRHVMGEDDVLINKKMHAILQGGLEVIFCLGELLSDREQGQTEKVVERQLRNGLMAVEPADMSRVTIAYEPVWAIGTGKTATPGQAQEAHAFCREIIADMFDESVAQQVRIQYGGSVKPENASELLGQKDVDGALVGGASLKSDSFTGIIKAGLNL